jgi:hypothetical protein
VTKVKDAGPAKAPADGDQKPRGVKTRYDLIPWQALPAELIPKILQEADILCTEDLAKGMHGVIRLLLDSGATLADAADAFAYGAGKYGPDNWCEAVWDDTAQREYFAALCRHLIAMEAGEERAADSGVKHAGHALANAMIIAWHTPQVRPGNASVRLARS